MLSCKMQRAAGAVYRNLRVSRARAQRSGFSPHSASGFSRAIRSLACWIISTRLSTLEGGGAAPARSTWAMASSDRCACKKLRTSNRSHQQSRISRQGFPPRFLPAIAESQLVAEAGATRKDILVVFVQHGFMILLSFALCEPCLRVQSGYPPEWAGRLCSATSPPGSLRSNLTGARRV